MTIRLRLTLVYGGLFLCSAAALLAITYVLVHHQYSGSFFISSGRQAVVHFQSSGAAIAKAQGNVFPVPVGPNGLAVSRRSRSLRRRGNRMRRCTSSSSTLPSRSL